MTNYNRGFIRHLIEKYTFIYERENGDRGLVIAETKDEAIKELKKVYDAEDIDIRLEANKAFWKREYNDRYCGYEWGMFLYPTNEANVYKNIIIVQSK